MVPEVMSQGEIDALLSALSSGSVDIDAINEEKKERAVKLYDFRRPDKFSKDQLRAIQMIHEAFSPADDHRPLYHGALHGGSRSGFGGSDCLR